MPPSGQKRAAAGSLVPEGPSPKRPSQPASGKETEPEQNSGKMAIVTHIREGQLLKSKETQIPNHLQTEKESFLYPSMRISQAQVTSRRKPYRISEGKKHSRRQILATSADIYPRGSFCNFRWGEWPEHGIGDKVANHLIVRVLHFAIVEVAS